MAARDRGRVVAASRRGKGDDGDNAATSQVKSPVRHTTVARTSAVSTAGTVGPDECGEPDLRKRRYSAGSSPESPNTERERDDDDERERGKERPHERVDEKRPQGALAVGYHRVPDRGVERSVAATKPYHVSMQAIHPPWVGNIAPERLRQINTARRARQLLQAAADELGGIGVRAELLHRRRQWRPRPAPDCSRGWSAPRSPPPRHCLAAARAASERRRRHVQAGDRQRRRLVLQLRHDALRQLLADARRLLDARPVAERDGVGEILRRQRAEQRRARPWSRRPARSAACGTSSARPRSAKPNRRIASSRTCVSMVSDDVVADLQVAQRARRGLHLVADAADVDDAGLSPIASTLPLSLPIIVPPQAVGSDSSAADCLLPAAYCQPYPRLAMIGMADGDRKRIRLVGALEPSPSAAGSRSSPGSAASRRAPRRPPTS